MNEKFYTLSKEKQDTIINAGFKVFSDNSYKKSPVQQIADEANISKSLLFYYFKDKKELYLFLWNKCAQITYSILDKYKVEDEPFFDALERGLKIKMDMLRKYPKLGNFAIRAYYEKDETVASSIQKLYHKKLEEHSNRIISNLKPEEFKEGLDLKMMYQEIYYASEGYLYEKMKNGKIDPDEIEEEYHKLILFWKGVYQR